MNELDRMEIVSNLKSVDEVILSIDEDTTQNKTLEYLRKEYPTEIPIQEISNLFLLQV